MASLNKVQLIGNLGADPEYMVAQGGFAVTKFRVATTEKFKDKSGEMREETEWHRVVLFGSLADIANKYLKKGSQVYIEGRIKTSSYDKDGEKRYATDIIGSSMQMLGSRQSSSDSQVSAKDGSSNYYSQPDVDTATNDDDDIPF